MMRVLLLLAALWSVPLAWAGGPAQDAGVTEASVNPVVEARIDKLAKELRCLVCQNQTLAESPSDFSRDMRREIRIQMEKGLTDQQVVDYLVARYGDFIRFRPPLKATTAPLWIGPFVLMVLAAALLLYFSARLRKRANNAPLSTQENGRLHTILTSGKEDNQG